MPSPKIPDATPSRRDSSATGRIAAAPTSGPSAVPIPPTIGATMISIERAIPNMLPGKSAPFINA